MVLTTDSELLFLLAAATTRKGVVLFLGTQIGVDGPRQSLDRQVRVFLRLSLAVVSTPRGIASPGFILTIL